jgi:hypothetical protein
MAIKIPTKTKKSPRRSTKTTSGSRSKARPQKAPALKVGEVISKSQAIAEYGEEFGPSLYAMMHAQTKKEQPTAMTRLRDHVGQWGEKEGISARFIGFAPGVPGPGELERTFERLEKDFEQERWTVLVFAPGTRAAISLPLASEFPPSGCSRYDIYTFAARFQPRRYWGDDFDTVGFEVNVRRRWREHRELPPRLDELLTALAHFGGYASQVAGIPDDDESYLRALMEAARARTVLHEGSPLKVE